MLTVTLKMSTNIFFYLTFVKVSPEKMCFLACSKAKTNEKLPQKMFYEFLDPKPFCTFLERKRRKNFSNI